MKCQIVYENKIEKCSKCGHTIFRLTKNKCKYTNKEKTEGVYRDIKVCDKCNHKRYFNELHFGERKLREIL